MNCLPLEMFVYLFILQKFTEAVTNEAEPKLDEDPCVCSWSPWMNNDDYSAFKGDNNSFANLRRFNYLICPEPRDIECRHKLNPNIPFFIVKQPGVDCNVTTGLVCVSRPKTSEASSKPFYCQDYETKVYCCDCPEVTTIPAPVNLVFSSKTVTNNKTFGATTGSVTVQDITPAKTLPLPISIIIVIIVATLLVVGIILCVVLTHKDKKRPKYVSQYMGSDSYLQRPVSFTDVDFMRSGYCPSSASGSPAGTLSVGSGERTNHRYPEFSKTKLELLLPTEAEDEPDVVSSTKRTNYEPVVRQMTEERRWFPDEYEQKMQAMKSEKRNRLTRPVAPPAPPVIPMATKKVVAFPDESK